VLVNQKLKPVDFPWVHHVYIELWLRFWKKASKVETIDWQGAVRAALCWGWIDGQIFSVPGENYYVQRFTPRRAKSIWSKKNVANVEQMIAEGKMRPPGLEKVDAARKDGRWAKAYDSKSAANATKTAAKKE